MAFDFDTSKKNVGNTDRTIRFAIGALLLLVAFAAHSALAAIIGLVLIGTAYLRFCPAYTVANVDTTTGDDPAKK